jgi:hypothetical protein
MNATRQRGTFYKRRALGGLRRNPTRNNDIFSGAASSGGVRRDRPGDGARFGATHFRE